MGGLVSFVACFDAGYENNGEWLALLQNISWNTFSYQCASTAATCLKSARPRLWFSLTKATNTGGHPVQVRFWTLGCLMSDGVALRNNVVLVVLRKAGKTPTTKLRNSLLSSQRPSYNGNLFAVDLPKNRPSLSSPCVITLRVACKAVLPVKRPTWVVRTPRALVALIILSAQKFIPLSFHGKSFFSDQSLPCRSYAPQLAYTRHPRPPTDCPVARWVVSSNMPCSASRS